MLTRRRLVATSLALPGAGLAAVLLPADALASNPAPDAVASGPGGKVEIWVGRAPGHYAARFVRGGRAHLIGVKVTGGPDRLAAFGRRERAELIAGSRKITARRLAWNGKEFRYAVSVDDGEEQEVTGRVLVGAFALFAAFVLFIYAKIVSYDGPADDKVRGSGPDSGLEACGVGLGERTELEEASDPSPFYPKDGPLKP